jgi:hypothetical protein
VHTRSFDYSVDYLTEIHAGGCFRWPELRPSNQVGLVTSPYCQESFHRIWLKIDTVLHRVQEYHFPVQSQFGTDWILTRKFNSINRWFLQLTFCCWSSMPFDRVSEFNSFWNCCVWPDQTRCCLTWYQSRSFRDYTLNVLYLHHLSTPWISYKHLNNRLDDRIKRIKQSFYWFDNKLKFNSCGEWESYIALLPIPSYNIYTKS